jgi:hypothetical protein
MRKENVMEPLIANVSKGRSRFFSFPRSAVFMKKKAWDFTRASSGAIMETS